MRQRLLEALAVLFLLPSLAFAQAPDPPATSSVDPNAAAHLAQEAAEDLAVTKALVGLRLTIRQLTELLPLLQQARTRLEALDDENAAAIARHRSPLREVRDELLLGHIPSSRAETQYAEALKLAESKRAKLRADLVGSIKLALAKQLGAEQEALLIQTARSLAFQERAATYRAEALTSRRGGEPVDRMGQMMDRVRGMSDDEFTRRQGQLRVGMERRASLSPEESARFAALMQQTRALPADVYQRQRDQLALQLWDQTLGRSGNTPLADPQTEVDRFIERYFLSPRIVPVVRQRLGEDQTP